MSHYYSQHEFDIIQKTVDPNNCFRFELGIYNNSISVRDLLEDEGLIYVANVEVEQQFCQQTNNGENGLDISNESNPIFNIINLIYLLLSVIGLYIYLCHNYV